ncbi:TadG family pilus assembly protein [Variovorax sp. UC122_21]
MIVIAAVALSLIVIALIGTELGYLFFMKREFQKAADLAALAGAQKLQTTTATNRCSQAAGVAINNAGQNLPGISINPPDCGNWRTGQASETAAGCFTNTDDHFLTGGAPLNAIRIRINQPAPTLLPIFPWDRTICVQAIAALDEPQASFSVGSGVARLNQGALNQLLGLLLGTTINLSLADYTGLANAKLNLLGMVDALHLNAGTVDQLAQSNITLAQLLNAAIEVLPQGNDSQTVSLVASLLRGMLNLTGGLDLNTVTINLLKTAEQAGLLSLDLDTTDPRSALNGNVSVLNLLSVALQVANGQSAAAAATTISLPPLAKVGVRAKVIEPPTIAIGPPGYYSDGTAKTQAHTGQVRAGLNVQILTAAGGNNSLLDIPLLLRVSLPAGQLINLPIYAEVASGDANLEDVRCTAGDGKYDVAINAAPGLAHVFLGNIPTAFSNTTSPWASLPKERFKLVSLRIDLLGSILTPPINVDLLAKLDLSIPANGSISRTTLNYRFDPNTPTSQQNLIQTVGLEQSLGAAIGSAIRSGALDVVLNTSGLGLVTNVLNALVNNLITIVNGLLGVLNIVLTPVLDLLDGAVLGPLFKALGLQLGYADVQLLSASCQSRAKLVH